MLKVSLDSVRPCHKNTNKKQEVCHLAGVCPALERRGRKTWQEYSGESSHSSSPLRVVMHKIFSDTR